MTLLDYSIPQFQFLVGGFDCTNYLDEIALSLPMHEIAQRLTWNGRFKVSFNRKARANGLPEAAFDQNQMPSRWRPAQVPIRLIIKGYTLPIMRIERYAYNPQTGTGEGSLHQILDVVAVDRPATEPGIEIYYTQLDQVVNVLVADGFRNATVATARSLGGLQGEILGGVVTRNPINDAQRLMGTQWRSLTVNNSETVVSHNCSVSGNLFVRSLSQIEIEPDIDHINFAATRVIVTGSRQVPKDIQPTPGQPKPKLQKTTEQQPYNQVYPGADGQGNNITPTTAEVKTIGYLYPNDRRLPFEIAALVPTELLFDLQTKQPIKGAENDKPYLTITVKEWPIGRITSLGSNNSLRIALVEIQSETNRSQYVPKLLLVPTVAGQPENFTLVPKASEKLTTTPVSPRSNQSDEIDPKTGRQLLLEPKPIIEGQKPIADQPMETQAVTGIASVYPAGWSPIQQHDHIVEVGFLPNEQIADQLAQNLAAREQRRRDSLKVVMPIPDEWLAANCPILPRVTLWDGTWLAEGLIVSLQGSEAKFAFSASRIARFNAGGVAIPVYLEVVDRTIKAATFVRYRSRILPPPVQSTVNLRAVPYVSTTSNAGGGDPGGGGGTQ